MSDAPERIFASPDTSCASNEWKSAMWHGHQHMQRPDLRTEYIRADLHRAHIDALQAQLADRDRALAEWAEVSQRNFQRAIEAEERLAEARAGLGHTISTGVPCGCGMTGPCMWSECKHPFAIRAKIGGAE
jgi:hypothetical protein